MKTQFSIAKLSNFVYNYWALIPHKCFHCGSSLIFVSQKTEKGEALFPITTVIYRCSDAICQKEIDKKTSDRIKFAKKQEKDKLERSRKATFKLGN